MDCWGCSWSWEVAELGVVGVYCVNGLCIMLLGFATVEDLPPHLLEKIEKGRQWKLVQKEKKRLPPHLLEKMEKGRQLKLEAKERLERERYLCKVC